MSKTTPLLILVSMVLLGVAYLSYTNSSISLSETAGVREKFEAKLSALRPLEEVQLDVSVFQEETFRYLELPTIPEILFPPPGRTNPFLIQK